MINATGHLFLSKTAPLAARTADGVFVLTLSVVDAIGQHTREPWCIHWAGADALAFWTTHRSALQPGCALHGTYSKLRVYYNARVPGIDAHVVTLALASPKPAAAKADAPEQPQHQPQPETTAP